ncbi:ATP-binding protein [Paraburkholderia sp. 32]|uniref:ATP-binding protein n=1 Tax=Paraburkholderia sp. 32 TaxID=2991057 RepID=UPI003D252112
MTAARKQLPLHRLDVALAREIVRLRARYQLSLDEIRGLFISDEQVDALLARHGTASSDWASLPVREPHSAIDAIAARFRLDAMAIDMLLFALAPDVDPSYARIYAYLNDDVRRRWPTIDLAQRMFGDTAHAALAADGPLFRPALLLPLATEESRAPLPLREFAANPALCAHLLGAMVVSRRGLALEPPSTADDCGPLASLGALISSGEAPVVAMTGTQPDAGCAAVGALARRLDRGVVRLTITADDDPSALLRDGALMARLADALLLIEADSIALPMLAPALRDIPVPVFLPVPVEAAWRHHLARMPLIEVDFAAPDGPARQGLWASALQRAGLLTDSAALTDVGQRFRLSARQIEVAAQSLRLGLGLRPDEHGSASANALLESARRQASVEFGGLAQRVKQTRGWDNLVLPPTTLKQLRRLSGAIRYRERVFSEWGFDGGPGITALFSGSPGTGKSMSVEALAREAGLDLWRIDLSSMVSKYIGETEKQLDRVFALARDGNAILFFDEADALFGKRSEVKDAHDRYANIEVAYLLQRLEAFEGVVILASNLASNVDPAFSRRMHFVIEFPLPDASLRERLWRAAIPSGARVAHDVDLAFLARQFALAGGDIRVAALDAAFAAVADEAPIDMARLCQAVSRQLLKQGKVPAESDFRQYQGLLASPQPRMAAR